MNFLKQRPWLIVIGVAVIVGGLIVGWWLASPLFLNQSVDESFPTPVASAPTATPTVAAMPDDAMDEAMDDAMSDDAMATVEPTPDAMVAEPTPTAEAASEPVMTASGQFEDADDFHKGSGSATIYELPDGSYVLRFEDFEVTNGPDLHVYLATGMAPTSRDDLGEYLDLGELKGNIGSQNYAIPAGTDLSQYHSVVIYCQPFHVVFATAALGM